MTKRFTIALIAVALFVLMAVMPVSAVGLFANGTVINQGATIFIGEQGLNVTHAMNQAYHRTIPNVGTPVQNNSALNPGFTRIGWWASAADLYSTACSKSLDLGVARRYVQMTVAPADFVGYTGNWYLIDNNNRVLTDPSVSGAPTTAGAIMVFIVADPSLDLKIWDYNQNADVTGKSVPQGEKLGFRIDTDMYPAVDHRYRNNVIDDSIVDAAPAWTVPYTVGDFQENNTLINITNSWWSNLSAGTIVVNPLQPCCPIYNSAVIPRFYNFTSYGAWYTWSNGYMGCDVHAEGPFYWNDSTRWSYPTTDAWLNAGYPVIFTPTVDTHDTGNFCSDLYAYTNKATDGYIDIKVKDEANAQFNALYSIQSTVAGVGPFGVLANYVDNQPWFWGTSASYPVALDATTGLPTNGFVWYTGAFDNFNQYVYPVGTYTICAESTLNKMKDNYKQGGADYTGKTVSQCYTVTLVSDTVKIEANKDSVVRSKAFSVTVTGRPSTNYYLWVKGTSTLDGTYDNQPPMMALNQQGVTMDPFAVPLDATAAQLAAGYPIGQYQYENGGGATIRNDVSVNIWTNNGTREYAQITTDTNGVRTIEWDTTNWTKAQKYTFRVEAELPPGSKNYKNDEVDVKVEKGAVTIVAAGDQSYYLGEEIKLSGTNTETYKTYLFIVGPNLPENGADIKNVDPRHYPVADGNPATFKVVDVNGDNTWSWKWGTALYALDAGTYTIYAVSQPNWKDNLGQAAYGTVSIIIKKPFVSATASQSTVAKGDRVYITGTAEGSPSAVQIWILGKNFYTKAQESVNSDSSFKYEVTQDTTKKLYSGQYFVVVQHPMQNAQFDVDTYDDHGVALNTANNVNDLWVYNLQLKDKVTGVPTKIFKLGGAGSLQGSDAAEALVQGINDANVDDTYTKLQFLVEEPVIRIDPIGDKHVGDKFTITAQTNLAVDDEVLVQVYSSSFKPTEKSQSGEFSGATGTVKVTKGDSGMNKISFDIDSSTFKPDEYIVTASAVIQEATGTALFNVLETAPVTVAPTTVATVAVTTVPPTTVAPTTVATAVPTTKSPGYGALMALIGLGAVAFIVVRRH